MLFRVLLEEAGVVRGTLWRARGGNVARKDGHPSQVHLNRPGLVP